MVWRRLLIALAIVGAIVLRGPAAFAQDSTVSWTVTPVMGEYYAIDSWLSLRVVITNNGSDATFIVKDGIYHTTVDVPGGGSKEVVLYAFLTSSTTRHKIALTRGNELIGEETVNVRTTTTPVIGTITEAPLNTVGTLRFSTLEAEAIPSEGIAYTPFAAVIIDGSGWRALEPGQIQALRNWVALGGVLITPAIDLETMPEDLRPGESGGNIVFDPTLLAAQFDQEAPLAPIPALEVRSNGGLALFGTPEAPLWVEQRIGKGKVIATAIAFDQPEFQSWGGLGAFWKQLLPSAFSARDDWNRSPVSNQDMQAPSYLSNLPALDLPPLKLLLVLLGVYIILVGPVNYVVLRRADRMALAWVTIPALTVLFGAITYGFGANQRGDDIIVNEIAIIKQYGDTMPQHSVYTGIFSPATRAYTIQLPEGGVARPMVDVWEQGVNQPINQAVFDQSNGTISAFKINQWTMGWFNYTLPITNGPQVTFDLNYADKQLSGTLTNASDYAIVDAILALGGDAQIFGRIEPGQQVPISLVIGRNRDWIALSQHLYGDELNKGGATEAGPDRELLRRAQAIDLIVPNTSYGAPTMEPVFAGFVDIDSAKITIPGEQLGYARKTVFATYPSIEFPNTELELDGRWMQISGEHNGRPDQVCYGPVGANVPGVLVEGNQHNVVFNLPHGLDTFQASELRLAPRTDGEVKAEDYRFEIYHWAEGSWHAMPFVGRDLSLQAGYLAGDYVRYGQVRVRFIRPDDQGNPNRWWGCMAMNLTLKGVQP